jgi:hypothetical protein
MGAMGKGWNERIFTAAPDFRSIIALPGTR